MFRKKSEPAPQNPDPAEKTVWELLPATSPAVPGAESVPNRLSYRDLLKSAKHKIPSLFGQLAYLAAFRDPGTGDYGDSAAEHFATQEVSEALRHEHSEIFEAWLCLSLEQQVVDVTEYLGAHTDRRQILRLWLQERPYTRLLSPTATAAQQQLFRSDLDLVLTLLQGAAQAAP